MCIKATKNSITFIQIIIKLCPRGEQTCAQHLFCCCDLDINPMTLKLEGDLDILIMYLHTENELARLRHSILLTGDEICTANKKYENNCQGQRSRSNVTNLQPLSAFIMDIFLSLHQFLVSSSQDFVWTDTQTDRRRQKQYLPAACAQVINNNNYNNNAISQIQTPVRKAALADYSILTSSLVLIT